VRRHGEAGPLFTPLAVELADTFKGLPISAAEMVLEAARGLLWTHHFNGADLGDIAFALEMPAPVLDYARRVLDASAGNLLAGEDLLLEVRLCLYSGAFAGMPGSRFAETWRGDLTAMLAAQIAQVEAAAGIGQPHH